MTESSSTSSSASWANSPPRYLLISLFWLPISLLWGMMLPQILPGRVEDFASEAQKGSFLGIIGVVGALASAAIQLVIGPISDHFRSRLGRRRPFLLVGTFVAAGSMIAFGWAHSFALLTISYVFIQLFLNIANGPYVAYMPDHVPREKQGIASAFMGLMQLIGKAGGPLVAGLTVRAAVAPYVNINPSPALLHLASLARLHAFQELLIVDAVLFVICVLITSIFVPDAPSTSATTPAQAVRTLFQWNIRSNLSFYWLLVSRGVYNLGFYIAVTYLQYYVQDSLKQGMNYSDALTKLQIFTIGGALLGTFPAGYFADRVSKKRIVYISCAFSAVATVMFGLAQSLNVACLMAIAFGVGYGVFCAVDWAFACNLLPEGGAAKYMAIWSLSDTIPQVIAPSYGPVADLINHRLGSGDGWRSAMLLAGVCVVAGAIVMRKVVENRNGPSVTAEYLLAASVSVP